jgi:hypothetical protein
VTISQQQHNYFAGLTYQWVFDFAHRFLKQACLACAPLIVKNLNTTLLPISVPISPVAMYADAQERTEKRSLSLWCKKPDFEAGSPLSW